MNNVLNIFHPLEVGLSAWVCIGAAAWPGRPKLGERCIIACNDGSGRQYVGIIAEYNTARHECRVRIIREEGGRG